MERFVIAITRRAGSGGTTIGEMLADEFSINLYDKKLIRIASERESFIVIGRGADYILKDKPNVFKIFLYASEEFCIEHEMSHLCTDRKGAIKYIKKWDNYRSEYYMYHTGKEWEKMSNYDLCINTGELGIEKSVKYIKEYIKLRMETL